MKLCIAPKRVFFCNNLFWFHTIIAQQTPKSPFHRSFKQTNFGTYYNIFQFVCQLVIYMYFCFYLGQAGKEPTFCQGRLWSIDIFVFVFVLCVFQSVFARVKQPTFCHSAAQFPCQCHPCGNPDWLIDQSRNRKEPNVAKHLSLTDHLLMGKNFSIYFLDCCPNLW